MLRRERIPVLMTAALTIMIMVLALGLRPTMGSWSARISNEANTVGTAQGVSGLNCYAEMQETTKKYGGYLYHFHTDYSEATNDSLNNRVWKQDNGQAIQPNRNWDYNGTVQASSEPCVGVNKHSYFPGGNSPGGGSSVRNTITANYPVTMPEQFTTETWINTRRPQGTVVVDSRNGNSTDPSWRVQVLHDGTVAFQVRESQTANTRTDQLASLSRIDDGRWHQVVTTWNSRTREMGIYLDGKPEVFSTSTSGLYQMPPNRGYIRYGYSGGNYAWPEPSFDDNFLGFMAFAAVYPTTLTATDVKRHWGARNGATRWPESTVG